MPFDAAGKQVALEAITAVATRIHIHNDDPGVGNSNQVASNETASWGSFSTDEIALSSNVQFSGMTANEDVLWFTIWNSAGSTRYGKGEITSGDTQANAAGEFELTTSTRLRLTDPA